MSRNPVEIIAHGASLQPLLSVSFGSRCQNLDLAQLTSVIGLQVKAGSIFDNIIVTDDLATATAFAEETWATGKEAEKAAFDKVGDEVIRVVMC